jgi:Ni/Co efflux regulator RcnB
MKRFLCAALLAWTLIAPTALAQDSGSAQAPRSNAQPTAKAEKQKGKEGQDCDTNRAGVRCSRPKPKKVWFWGKA